MSASRVLLGAVIGMAAGAVLGVLFAPNKGSATRKKLSRQGSRFMGALNDTASEYVDGLGKTIASAKESAVGFADRVSGAVDSLSGHASPKTVRRGERANDVIAKKQY